MKPAPNNKEGDIRIVSCEEDLTKPKFLSWDVVQTQLSTTPQIMYDFKMTV